MPFARTIGEAETVEDLVRAIEEACPALLSIRGLDVARHTFDLAQGHCAVKSHSLRHV